MKTRIITAVIGIILLALILYLGGWFIFGGVLILSLIGLYEYQRCVGGGDVGLFWPSALMGLAIVLVMKFDYYTINYLLMLCLVICLMIEIFTTHNFTAAAFRMFGLLYVPLMFSYLMLFDTIRHGMVYIIMIFVGGFSSDIFAYFVGRAVGGKKLAPELSPKKTVAGSIGGIIGDMACMCLYGWILQSYFSFSLPYWQYALMGAILAVAGQLGDLSASMIKRQFGVKDYGKLFPGHGGVLDRFDAVLFVIPIVYFFATVVQG